ncbi:MAG: hypothetical protein HY077_09225 [Elusimicrobia bacterium]|nr:hypothetical protein [Elusimicrobiota bacterium]
MDKLMNGRASRTLRLALALSLSASAAFGVEFRAVNLKVLPPSAVVVSPGGALTAGLPAPVSSLITMNQAMATELASKGPVVVLDAGGGVLMIPQTIRPGAQALVMPQGGGKAELVPITKEMASALREQIKDGDIAGAAKTLGHTFDASVAAATPSTPVVAPDAASGEKAPEAKLARGDRKSHGDQGTGKAPPTPAKPAAPATDVSDTQDKGKTWEKATPLPPAVEIPSALASLDDAVVMGISHPYPGVPAVDPGENLAKDIDAYIAFKGIKTEDKHFIIKYFEIGDAKVVDAIAKLKKAGIKTYILTDFNQSMTGKFTASDKHANGETHNTDFENGTYKDGNPGKALKRLREELGFEFTRIDKKTGQENKFVVVSGVPFFNPADKAEKPLMHDKGYFGLGMGGKAWDVAGNGTANMNATQDGADGSKGGRYNRVFRSLDPVANQVDWDHAMAEFKAYEERTFSKGLPAELNVPKRVTYPNGEYREIAFTNGKQNPNDRKVAKLQRATQALIDAKARRDKGDASAKPDFRIKEYILSEFVDTYTPEVDALRKWLDAMMAFYGKDEMVKQATIYGVFDQQFISPAGFGEAAAFDGLAVLRPMGKSIFPFRTEYTKMMKLFGYIRLLDGVKSIDPDKAPTTVHLWHDKTSMMKTEEDDASGATHHWTYAWTRSLNNSNHFQSLESQDEYRMLADSKLAKQFEDSIKKVVENEPKWAIDLDKAIVIEVLAQITHHTRYDEGMLGYAEKTIDALIKKNYSVVENLITEIIALPTKHVRAVNGDEVKKRVGEFIAFMNKYDEESKKDRSLNEMTYRKAINVAVGLIGGGWNLRTALDIIFWGPHRSDADLEKIMRTAWTDWLHMDTPFPEPKTPRPAADNGGAVAAGGKAKTGA